MTTRGVKRIDELARDIPPTRDLWPAIAQAIQVDLSMKAVPTRRRVGWMPALGLAASVALVALGVVIGMQFGTPGKPEVANTTIPASNAGLMPAALREAEYQKQRDQLLGRGAGQARHHVTGRARKGGRQSRHAEALDPGNRSSAGTRSRQCAAARLVSEFVPGRNARPDRGA